MTAARLCWQTGKTDLAKEEGGREEGRTPAQNCRKGF